MSGGEWSESRLTKLMENVITRSLTVAAQQHEQAQVQLLQKMSGGVRGLIGNHYPSLDGGAGPRIAPCACACHRDGAPRQQKH